MTDYFKKLLPRGATTANQDRFDRDGNTRVSIQDQWTDIVDFEARILIAEVTLAVDVVMGESTMTLVPGHGALVGEHVCLRENEPVIVNEEPDLISEIGRQQQSEILAVNGDVITLDTPMDYAFTTAAEVCRERINLNVDGSVTPVIADISPRFPTAWDIVRFTIYIEDTSAMTDNLFGNLPALTNGVVFRKKNSDIHTFFNAKRNGEFKVRNYDLTYFASAVAGPGNYSLVSRRTFGGQDKNGVVVRLDGKVNDRFEVVIQDDLTALSSIRVVAQGHLVDPF